jgi:hypothetical protein
LIFCDCFSIPVSLLFSYHAVTPYEKIGHVTAIFPHNEILFSPVASNVLSLDPLLISLLNSIEAASQGMNNNLAPALTAVLNFTVSDISNHLPHHRNNQNFGSPSQPSPTLNPALIHLTISSNGTEAPAANPAFFCFTASSISI